MPSSCRIGVKVIARLVMTSALLWLACGDVPQVEDEALRQEGPVAKALQGAASGRWRSTAMMAAGRSQHSAIPLPGGEVLVVGGQSASGSAPSSAEVYDLATGLWSPTGPLTTARIEPSATLLPSGGVLLTAGLGQDGFLASAEVYDPATGTWSFTGSLATPRYWHTATLLPSGEVLVTGGYGPGGSLSSVEVYEPSTSVWSPAEPLAMARLGHTATLLPSGEVLVTGGMGSDNFLASTEVYDPGLAGDPPEPPVVSLPAFVTTQRPTITGTAEAESTITVSLDGTVAGTITASATGLWAFTPSTPLTDGTHQVAATAMDAAGNVSDDSAAVSFFVDTMAPAEPAVLEPEEETARSLSRPGARPGGLR